MMKDPEYKHKEKKEAVRRCYESWVEWAPSKDLIPYPEMLEALVKIFNLYGHDTVTPFKKQNEEVKT